MGDNENYSSCKGWGRWMEVDKENKKNVGSVLSPKVVSPYHYLQMMKLAKLKLADPRKIRKRLIKRLDDAFSLYIRARDMQECWAAGLSNLPKCSKTMQCNHKITRANYRLRWDERNAVCGCSAHNLWAHFNQSEWNTQWRALWPKDVEYLDRARKQLKKYANTELELFIQHFKGKINDL